MIITQKQLVVYELPKGWNTSLVLPDEISWTTATRESVMSFFGYDRWRRDTFARFLHKGYWGVILYIGNDWVNYGWVSRPETLGPPHLPRDVQEEQVYWLFYQHTRAEYRGRGYYKLALGIQIEQILAQDRIARVRIDARDNNTASRRGILSVGFNPKGVVNTRELTIPRIKTLVWGNWDMDMEHPLLS